MRLVFTLNLFVFLIFISTVKQQTVTTQKTKLNPIKTFKTSIACTYPLSSTFCGQANRTSINSRLINGFNATDRQWPWLAYVIRDVNNQLTHLGTATIISKNNVITSGSYLNNIPVNELIIVYGTTQLTTSIGNLGFSFVSKIIKNPKVTEYNNSEIINNLVILNLNSPITYSVNTLPICLPNSVIRFQDILNQEVYTAGWGSREDYKSQPVNLKYARLNITTDKTICNDVYYNSSLNYCGKDLNLNPSYPCLSDYGSPLMYYNNGDGKWYLYGVLTKLNIDSNNQCLSTPYYFAQISSVIYWIYDNIAGS